MSTILDEVAALELLERDAQLFLRVHDDRPLPGDGLADRLPRDEDEARPLVAGADGDAVAVAEVDEVAVARAPIADVGHALEDVGEGGVAAQGRVDEARAGRQADVEVLG